jgi:DNA-binding transcriptional MerR regulator/effector-binding domain-containing protein
MDMPPVGERLLTIGEFSRLSQLSVRMLRYYDEHGVLRPTHVDGRSGYRSYSPALLRTARQVRRLRDAGLGVAELAVLERHRTRLIAESAAVAARIREVDVLITGLEVTTMPDDLPVEVRTLPARLVASLRDTIPTYADEGLLWQRLRPALLSGGAALAPDACAVAVFHDEDYRESDCDVEVQIGLAAPFAPPPGADGVRCVELPAQEVAVGVVHGPYEGVGAVMEAVGRWVAEHGYAFAGPMFDVYRVSPQDDPEPAHWVTEVCQPVEVAR